MPSEQSGIRIIDIRKGVVTGQGLIRAHGWSAGGLLRRTVTTLDRPQSIPLVQALFQNSQLKALYLRKKLQKAADRERSRAVISAVIQ
jgi:hypothetical protein